MSIPLVIQHLVSVRCHILSISFKQKMQTVSLSVGNKKHLYHICLRKHQWTTVLRTYLMFLQIEGSLLCLKSLQDCLSPHEYFFNVLSLKYLLQGCIWCFYMHSQQLQRFEMSNRNYFHITTGIHQCVFITSEQLCRKLRYYFCYLEILIQINFFIFWKHWTPHH